MYKLLSKYGLAIAIGVAAIMIASSVMIYVANGEAYIVKGDSGEVVHNTSGITEIDEGDTFIGEVSALFGMGYVLLFAAIAGALIIFPIKSLIENPKNALKALAGIAVIVLIYFVSVGISETSMTQTLLNLDTPPSDASLNFTSGVLGTSFILLVLGIVSIIGSEIYKLVK